MKTNSLAVLSVFLALPLFAVTPVANVQVNANTGVLTSPTNFISANGIIASGGSNYLLITSTFNSSTITGATTFSGTATMQSGSLITGTGASGGSINVHSIKLDGVPVSTGGGTVTSVSVTTANGVSGTVATATTTPAISILLGAITPTSVNGNFLTTGTGTLNLAGFTLGIAQSGTLGTAAYTAATAYDASGAAAAAQAASQPLDADLTAIAALTTATFGRSILTGTDAAAVRTLIGAGSGSGTVTNVSVTVGGFTITNPTTTPVLSGTLIVPNGGTGVGTLTGIPYGTGTAALGTVTIGGGLLFTGGVLTGSSGTVTTATSALVSGTIPSPIALSVSGAVATLSGTTHQSFFAMNSGTNMQCANNTATKLLYNSTLRNDGGSFDTTNSKWVAPRAGTVLFNAKILFLGGLANAQFYCFLYKNGTQLRVMPDMSNGGVGVQISCGGASIETVAANDYFEIYGQQSSGSTQNAYSDAAGFQAYFQGIYLP